MLGYASPILGISEFTLGAGSEGSMRRGTKERGRELQHEALAHADLIRQVVRGSGLRAFDRVQETARSHAGRSHPTLDFDQRAN